MKKGKFGLSLAAIAIIAFGFTILRQPTAVLLVCGFALLAEKDEWLNRQVLQALLLTLVYYLVDLVAGWIFGVLSRFFDWVKLYRVVETISKVDLFIGSVLYLGLIGLSIFAIVRLLSDKEAGLPLISKLAAGDFKTVAKAKTRPTTAQASASPRPEAYVAPQPTPAAQSTEVPTQPKSYTPPQPIPVAESTEPTPSQSLESAQSGEPAQSTAATTEEGQAKTKQDTPQPTPVVEAEQAAATPQSGLSTPPPIASQAAPTVKYCRNCATPLREDSKFCTVCGAKVE